MTSIKLYTPANFVTLSSLVCGCIGIKQALDGQLIVASYCIYLAAVLDFLDGFVARLFNSTSEIGKQLDSLCDMVSFGVLPGFILYSLLEEYKWIALLVPLCSALRLAKFNVDERQSEGFIGVPTPINALFITSLAFILKDKVVLQEVNYFLITVAVITSFLLVAEFPLLSLKFKSLAFSENRYRFILIFVSIVFIVLLKQSAFGAIYISYILLSLIKNILQEKEK